MKRGGEKGNNEDHAGLGDVMYCCILAEREEYFTISSSNRRY